MAVTPSSSYAVMTSLVSTPDELMAQIASPASREQLEALMLQARRQRLTSSDPRWLQVEALGLIFLDQSKLSLSLLDKLTSPHQGEADTWVLRGMALRKSKQDDQALAAYKKAHSLEPGRADILYNIANILLDISPQEAIQYYSQSLSINPLNSLCWFNCGLACLNADDPEAAIRCLAIGLRIDPLNDDALCNYGLALVKLASLGSAERAFMLSLDANGQNLEAFTNLGNVKMSKCEPVSALPYLMKGSLSSAKPRLNLGLCQLLLGQFESGWDNYESRLESIKPPCSGPQLSSFDPVDNGRAPLIVWSEQGLGDSIMFARYLLLLDARRIQWSFYCPGVLLNLFENWMNTSGSILHLDSLPPHSSDYHIPLLSLPRLFQTSLGTVPSLIPYLQSPSEIPTPLRFEKPPGGLSVGLVWASDPSNHSMYRHKSIPLDLLMPRLVELVDLDLIDIHSIQVGADVNQLRPWSSHARITDWSLSLSDFEATAFVVQQLDLVISVDTAVAHLAGSLNIPTWLLLPANADFRWLRGQSDSPWYPGCMRLFRQSAPGDWQSVVSSLCESLDELFLLKLQDVFSSKIG